MKNLLNFALYVATCVTTILFLSLLIPVIISTFIVLFTGITFEDCIISITFWLFFLIGTFVYSVLFRECFKQ